jgi:spore coat polysaccharide biosynthesis predicted glycosyltransferase SpsG
MQVTIPENIKDITLEQFQKYSKVLQSDKSEREKQKRTISIFTDIKYSDTDNIVAKDFDYLITKINDALNKDAEFTPIFKMNSIEFGFIPNFDKLTAKEWFDLQLYPIDKIEDYNKLMAILFRPIKNKAYNQYNIRSYKGTSEYSELMKQTPMSVVNGALVFFYNLGRELSSHSLKSMREELMREIVL